MQSRQWKPPGWDACSSLRTPPTSSPLFSMSFLPFSITPPPHCMAAPGVQKQGTGPVARCFWLWLSRPWCPIPQQSHLIPGHRSYSSNGMSADGGSSFPSVASIQHFHAPPHLAGTEPPRRPSFHARGLCALCCLGSLWRSCPSVGGLPASSHSSLTPSTPVPWDTPQPFSPTATPAAAQGHGAVTHRAGAGGPGVVAAHHHRCSKPSCADGSVGAFLGPSMLYWGSPATAAWQP